MTGRVQYRPATIDDLVVCTQIWSLAIEAYVRRLNQPWFSGDAEPLRRLLAHFLRTDPDRFWVATDRPDQRPAHEVGRQDAPRGPERVVGFGSATLRDDVWFLGMLFVLPECQGAGVGRHLLERLMPAGTTGAGPPAEDPPAMGTATDSVQPVSNALYSRHGLVPRLPVFNFVGRPERPDAMPPLPAGVTITESESRGPNPDTSDPETSDIAIVDLASLGRVHPQDHAFLSAEGRRRFVARSGRGEVLGYGYIAPSGRFGPVAATDGALLAPIAGHMLSSVRAPGAYATWVPGDADALFEALLRAGFRFESFPALLAWNRPVADFSRYIPINLALL